MSRIPNAPVSPIKSVETCCESGGKKIFVVEYTRIIDDRSYVDTKNIQVVATTFSQVEKYILGLSEYPGMKIVVNSIRSHDKVDVIL